MTNQTYCIQCNTLTVAGERFCGECGSDLTKPGSVVAGPAPNPTPSPTEAYPTNSNAPFRLPSLPSPVYQQSQSVVTPTRVRGGGTSPLLIVGAGVLLAILAASGYFLLNNKGTGGGNQVSGVPTTTPAGVAVVAGSPTPGLALASDTPIDQGSPADPALKAEVVESIEGMRALDSYHTKISGSYNGTQLVLDGDFSKTASQFNLSYSGRTYNAIFVNNRQYVSADSGKSWKADNSLESLQGLTTLFDSPALTRTNKISDLGNETLVSGEQAHKILIDDTAANEQDTLWIIEQGGTKLIARIKGVNTTEGSKYDLTLDYSDFDKPLDIVEPKLLVEDISLQSC